MLYVFQHKPLVTALTLWSLLSLIVVPLSAQNILVTPGPGVSRPLYLPVCTPAPTLNPPMYRIPVSAIEILSALRSHRDVPLDSLRVFTEIKKVDEEKQLREAWQEAFGFDVWYPYYKEKEIEGWVRAKFRVRLFRMKGEPQFNSKGFIYTFKSEF